MDIKAILMVGGRNLQDIAPAKRDHWQHSHRLSRCAGAVGAGASSAAPAALRSVRDDVDQRAVRRQRSYRAPLDIAAGFELDSGRRERLLADAETAFSQLRRRRRGSGDGRPHRAVRGSGLRRTDPTSPRPALPDHHGCRTPDGVPLEIFVLNASRRNDATALIPQPAAEGADRVRALLGQGIRQPLRNAAIFAAWRVDGFLAQERHSSPGHGE